MSKTHDLFISYASQDKKLAHALCHFLEENNLRCWMAPWDIVPRKEYWKSFIRVSRK